MLTQMKCNRILEYSPALAEILGIMIGDGGICIDKKNKYHTTIAFNKKEKDYLYYVKRLFDEYFKPYKFCLTNHKDELFLSNVSVFIGKQLVNFGLKSGDKVKNKIAIPEWITNNADFLKRVIRGLFDTDGCVYCKYDKFAQIQFKLACEESIRSIREALIKLKYNPTKIQREKYAGLYSWKIYLVRQKEIQRFFEEIQPMNHKHVLRYNKIKDGDARI